MEEEDVGALLKRCTIGEYNHEEEIDKGDQTPLQLAYSDVPSEKGDGD
jgi:hypothetical protein